MDESKGSFPDLLGLFKTWIQWRSEPTNVSKDFWMPDESCRVCYECDSQFTLFNRRHHCRLCGRIFCAKCTSNWIPAETSEVKTIVEEWDRIRVCNYCFKQREQGLMGIVDNGPAMDISSASQSATSLLSTKSSGTCGGSSITFASLPQSSGLSPHQSAIMETALERQNGVASTVNDRAVDRGEEDLPQNQFEFCRNRSDNEEEEEFVLSHLSSRISQFPSENDYYEHVQYNEINDRYKSHELHVNRDAADSKSMSTSPIQNSFNSLISEEVQQIIQKSVAHDVDECETPSSLYVAEAEGVNNEPMDFENDEILWLPPGPEDEEEEREALLFDSEDDKYAAGEWGYLSHLSSFGSGESRIRDKFNEEHNKAMKTVVDGHFRALVFQLLQVENLLSEDENDKGSWLEIITALSWEAATFIKPDTSNGGQMDPGKYVKVKCLASGLRNESMVVKGIVCKKNVAHRRMTSKIGKPRILILGGALEYQRISNALSSLDTLLQQEMDHLKMAVAKIDAHSPDILLVEKSVSRYAQEYLLAKDISLVLNIKRPLLERISQCTGAQIVPSIDNLSSNKVGYCDMLHVERFVEEHGSAGQVAKKLVKTLMYFEGCPKPLGCTILLRGANGDELKKVKHVVQYGVFAAYHLALETSFLADEGASLPELPLSSLITVALPDKPSVIGRSISTVPGLMIPAGEKSPGPLPVGEPLRSSSVPTPVLKETIASIHGTECSQTCDLPALSSQYTELRVSSSVKGFQHFSPNEIIFNRALEDQAIADLALSLEARPFEAEQVSTKGDRHISCDVGDSEINTTPSDYNGIDANRDAFDPSSLKFDELQIHGEQPALREDLRPSPSDNRSILVSLSSRCVWKGTVCKKSHLHRITYYGSFDEPLGRFLRDHFFDQSYVCRSCELPVEAHVQCYTHREGTLTISMKKVPEVLLSGEKDGKIWMWHRCLKCPRINGFPPATRRVVMSDAAWGLSFGKFLELSFSNHAAASRVASCGHSLHRDCLRFYGYGNKVACFRYASIDVHSVYLPPPKLDFNYEKQEWLERELNEVIGRAELLFSEVLNALCLLAERTSGPGMLRCGLNIPESRRHIADLEVKLQKEKLEFEELIQKILNKETEKGQPAIDILELNQLRRQLVFQSYIWDRDLVHASNLDAKNRPEDTCATSPDPIKKPLCDTPEILDTEEITGIDIVPGNTDKTLDISEPITEVAKPEQNPCLGVGNAVNGVVHQRNDVAMDFGHGKQSPLAFHTGMKATDTSDPVVSGVAVRRALSNGQVPICLSLTLDAAWTGGSNPGVGIAKNNFFPDSVQVYASSMASVTDKSDTEVYRVGLCVSSLSQPPSVISNTGSEKVDEAVSSSGMSFPSPYRSLNTYSLGSDLKLGALSEYAPVYISSFRDSEVQGGARLLLPLGVTNTVIPVYDDEPTSIISYALVSPDYYAQLSDEPDRPKDAVDSTLSMQSLDGDTCRSFYSLDETVLDSYRNVGPGDETMLTPSTSLSSLSLDPVLYNKALHARVSFSENGPLGKAKYYVTCYFAKRFEALRRICCPSEEDFIRSLSRCKKWGAQGGKSNVFFAKTLDDRFIIKQVTKTELESFIEFAAHYFKYLSESISSGSPTCLAKILGIYQVTSKHLKGGKEMKMDVLVMENLLFGRNVTRLYDLKGSSRSRYNADSSGSNKVLLDQNLIEAMPTSPIFVGDKAKRLLERAVWNDTAFLASIDVMDYSLLVGIDEEKHELVLGIIDFMRQYTWDKHLETWVKASGILGGPKNALPTVISPMQYKRRFRKAMTTYFLKILDQWSPNIIVPSKSQTELSESSPSEQKNISSVCTVSNYQ